MMTIEPPAWYAPEQLAHLLLFYPERAAEFIARYDEANQCYLAAACQHVEWTLLVRWRLFAQGGAVGGPHDGARGTGGADRQEV